MRRERHPGSRLRSVSSFSCVWRRSRVDIEIEELGQWQSCERLLNLRLVGGDNFDKGGTSGRRNVVGANPSVRAEHLQFLLLVSSQRGELAKSVLSRTVATTMNVWTAGGFVVVGMFCPFD